MGELNDLRGLDTLAVAEAVATEAAPATPEARGTIMAIADLGVSGG